MDSVFPYCGHLAWSVYITPPLGILLHPPTVYTNACFFTTSPTVLNVSLVWWMRRGIYVVLISIYHIMSEVEYLFLCLQVIAFLFLWTVLVVNLCQFFLVVFPPPFSICERRSYILTKVVLEKEKGESRALSLTKLTVLLGSLNI